MIDPIYRLSNFSKKNTGKIFSERDQQNMMVAVIVIEKKGN